MSPDAVRGDAQDERSDVFRFSVTAWEALYGELLFAGMALHATGAQWALYALLTGIPA